MTRTELNTINDDEGPVRDPSAGDDAFSRLALALIAATGGRLRRLRRLRFERVELEYGDETGEAEPQAAEAASGGVHGAHGVPELQSDPGLLFVCSPMVGTFYHAPEPGARPFIGAGDVVEQGSQVGIVEAMKLMNPIESEVNGRVVEVLVPDATPVEYGQPLIALAPLEAV